VNTLMLSAFVPFCGTADSRNARPSVKRWVIHCTYDGSMGT
jgi:hypothetical protein